MSGNLRYGTRKAYLKSLDEPKITFKELIDNILSQIKISDYSLREVRTELTKIYFSTKIKEYS